MTTNAASNGRIAIRLEQVTRHYQMGDTVVRAADNITLDIAAGEFVALLGSSGSGKSTLMNLMAGLDRPTSGAIFAHDRNLAGMSSEELAKHRTHTIGIVFQAFNLLPRMTLEENVELPLRLAEVDLQLRGPGEMAGTRQSGMPEFRIANLMLDGDLLSLAQKEAQRWAERSGERERLIEALSARSVAENRHLRELALADAHVTAHLAPDAIAHLFDQLRCGAEAPAQPREQGTRLSAC